MAIPSIDVLRQEADQLLQPRVSDGQMEAIIAGALAAYNNGTPIPSDTSFQNLVLQCQPLIDQARRDVRAIYLSQFLVFLEGMVACCNGGGTPEPPAPTPFTVYYGRGTDTVLTEAQILALTSVSVTSQSGNYSYSAGSGYLYIAIPNTRALSSVKIGSFDVPLAGATEGYSGSANGLNYTTVTVSGTVYKLYRTYNTTAGAAVLRIT